jgi:hypothetical protein
VDEGQFDELARVVGAMTSRRQVLRSALALMGAGVGMRALGADAARRGYSGPQSGSANDDAVISVQPSWASAGRCHLEGYVTGAPAGAAITISLQAYRNADSFVNEAFRVTADAQGRAHAVSVGTFEGTATCSGSAAWAWTSIHSYPYNLRCT